MGTSEAASSNAAGRAAAAAAVAELAGEPPALVIVYGSVRYHLPDLLAGVREITGEVPLVGASSSGHFHNGSVTMPGRGVAVLALSAGPYRFGVGSVAGLRDDPLGAGQALARAAKRAAGPELGPHAAMLVLADGLIGSQQQLLTGIYKVAGAAVPVVGGSAGDDRWLRRTSVFHDDLVLTGGAVGVWISSPWPLPVAVGHGWRPVGLPLLVTDVDGPVVHEIDGRPALEVVREHLSEAERDLPPGWLQRSGMHPAQAFGLIEPDGSQLVRGAYGRGRVAPGAGAAAGLHPDPDHDLRTGRPALGGRPAGGARDRRPGPGRGAGVQLRGPAGPAAGAARPGGGPAARGRRRRGHVRLLHLRGVRAHLRRRRLPQRHPGRARALGPALRKAKRWCTTS
ncbi:MAG TPA: FIST N-terminal domain-containing protein [Natronosporangium sp.]